MPVRRRPCRLVLAALVASASAPPAFAAHPLQTEDTGTQGARNVELENGFARAVASGGVVSTYQPQLSVGLATTFDAIVQPSVVVSHVRGQGVVSGLGDTNLDGKWRFWGADPWSFAIRAGLQLPTSQRGLGLPHHELSEHALLVATWDAAPTTVYANLGVTHSPFASGLRRDVVHASAAVLQTIDERLILTVDGGLDQDPSAARHAWPGYLLGGAIWTARPGLDLDVGYQTSVHAAPTVRQWLAGVTWRFSM